jgi:hypothetical protein
MESNKVNLRNFLNFRRRNSNYFYRIIIQFRWNSVRKLETEKKLHVLVMECPSGWHSKFYSTFQTVRKTKSIMVSENENFCVAANVTTAKICHDFLSNRMFERIPQCKYFSPPHSSFYLHELALPKMEISQ